MSCVPVNCGGTSVGLSNDGVAAKDAARKRSVPLNMQGLAARTRAAQLLEAGKPHQRSQGNPVAGRAVCGDGAHAHRSEGRRAEAGERFQAGHGGMRILKHQAAVVQRQHGMEARVCRSHFDLFVARKGRRHVGLEKEDQPALDGQVVGAAQLHGLKRRGSCPAERPC